MVPESKPTKKTLPTNRGKRWTIGARAGETPSKLGQGRIKGNRYSPGYSQLDRLMVEQVNLINCLAVINCH